METWGWCWVVKFSDEIMQKGCVFLVLCVVCFVLFLFPRICYRWNWSGVCIMQCEYERIVCNMSVVHRGARIFIASSPLSSPYVAVVWPLKPVGTYPCYDSVSLGVIWSIFSICLVQIAVTELHPLNFINVKGGILHVSICVNVCFRPCSNKCCFFGVGCCCYCYYYLCSCRYERELYVCWVSYDLRRRWDLRGALVGRWRSLASVKRRLLHHLLTQSSKSSV